jgi:hypothetical protein
MLAHGLEAQHVQAPIGLSDLQLDAADAALDRGRRVDQKLLGRGMQEAARGVVARVAMLFAEVETEDGQRAGRSAPSRH